MSLHSKRARVVSSLVIDVHGEPPTEMQIKQAEREEMSALTPGMQVMLFVPIPIVDVVAGLVTDAAMGTLYPKGDWQESPGAIERDWSSTDVTASYVGKVRSAGRTFLVHAEVTALKAYVERVNSTADVAKRVLDGLFGQGNLAQETDR